MCRESYGLGYKINIKLNPGSTAADILPLITTQLGEGIRYFLKKQHQKITSFLMVRYVEEDQHAKIQTRI
jgi:hypothetical protein